MAFFRIPQCPFDAGNKLFNKSQVTINPGITPLIGCNGAGKSTLMLLLSDRVAKRKNAVLLKYNDRMNGGHNLMEKMASMGDMEFVANMIASSEGERIYQGLGNFVPEIRKAVVRQHPKEIWVMLDCIGSGLSIDNIVEIKELIPMIQENDPDIRFYFVVATNEYEFVRECECIDAQSLGHMRFNDYEEYRAWILKTREIKDNRGWT